MPAPVWAMTARMSSSPGTDRTSDGTAQSNPPMLIVPIPSIGVNGSIGGTFTTPGPLGPSGVVGPPPLPPSDGAGLADCSGRAPDGAVDGAADRVGVGVAVGSGSRTVGNGSVGLGTGTRTVGRGSGREGSGIGRVGSGTTTVGRGVGGEGVGVGEGVGEGVGVGVGVADPTVIVTVAGADQARPSQTR
jgi:hypothetical protein